MAVYAIGDLQGCLSPLEALLEQLRFDPASDRIWFVGDLVNRGPDSAACLRYVRDMGDAAITTLGNHDLHLLAVWAGTAKVKRKDTVHQVLEAPDGEELLHWLRHRNLTWRDDALGYFMVHAGVPPVWSLHEAQAHGRELEAVLRSDDYLGFFRNMYGNQPDRWEDDLDGWDRLRYICNAFTRMRYVDADGRLDMRCSSAPGSQPDGLYPWYEMRERLRPAPDPLTIVTGHWSTLGLCQRGGNVAIDTGCLWGGELTALRLDSAEREVISRPCPAFLTPK